jgi:hypothetical protein
MARILYCHCAFARIVPEDTKNEVLEGLTRAGVEFDAIPDLCHMAAAGDPHLSELAGEGPLRIAACYPRAVKWLFASAGVNITEQGAVIHNMRVSTPADVLKGVLGE